ncbi:MAG TPA: lmo0937 family membrane protein [Arthrobacter sp.]|nr:lmo0937 family membrane protein [Arthrobacter sp.]
MLLWIAIILAVLWLLGLLGSIGGGFIHLLLVVAVIVLVFHFIRGRSSRV